MPISHVWYRYSQQINMVHSVLPSDARITSFSHRLYMCAVYILCAVLCVIACFVLSCPCRRCEQNWRQDKTVLSHLHPVSNLQLFSLKYIEDYWKLNGNWKLGRDKTELSCLVSSCVHTVDTDKTRQSCLVLSVSAV